MTLRIRPALPDDRARVELLVAAEQLPLQGLDEHFADFLVAEIDGEVAAAAGIERHEQYALLSSVVVAPTYRGQRVAEQLVRAHIEAATRHKTRALYLLTMTAEAYFVRLGFELIDRELVPPVVKRSPEFVSACPASAHAMALTLVSEL